MGKAHVDPLIARTEQIIKKTIRDKMVLSAPATNRAAEIIALELKAKGMLVDPDEGGSSAEAEDEAQEAGGDDSD